MNELYKVVLNEKGYTVIIDKEKYKEKLSEILPCPTDYSWEKQNENIEI